MRVPCDATRGEPAAGVFEYWDRLHYLRLMAENLADTQTWVLAFCLMTNHVHFVAVPESDDALAVLFRRVHGRYLQYLNVRRHRTGLVG